MLTESQLYQMRVLAEGGEPLTEEELVFAVSRVDALLERVGLAIEAENLEAYVEGVFEVLETYELPEDIEAELQEKWLQKLGNLAVRGVNAAARAAGTVHGAYQGAKERYQGMKATAAGRWGGIKDNFSGASGKVRGTVGGEYSRDVMKHDKAYADAAAVKRGYDLKDVKGAPKPKRESPYAAALQSARAQSAGGPPSAATSATSAASSTSTPAAAAPTSNDSGGGSTPQGAPPAAAPAVGHKPIRGRPIQQGKKRQMIRGEYVPWHSGRGSSDGTLSAVGAQRHDQSGT